MGIEEEMFPPWLRVGEGQTKEEVSDMSWCDRKKGTIERPSPKVRNVGYEVSEGEDGELVATKRFKPGSKIFAIDVTNSMDPVFDDGHLVIGEPLKTEEDYADLIPGDVVIYSTGPGSLISHRIASIYFEGDGDARRRYYRFRGDNNDGLDPVIGYDEMVLYRIVQIDYGILG